MVQINKDQFTETVRAEADRQADLARQELGEIVIDATGKYFPEAIKQRRRRDIASGFVVGALVGFLIRYLVSD